MFFVFSQFSRSLMFMFRCGSVAPPSPTRHTLPSSRAAWLRARNPPTEDLTTEPVALPTPREQQATMLIVAQYTTQMQDAVVTLQVV